MRNYFIRLLYNPPLYPSKWEPPVIQSAQLCCLCKHSNNTICKKSTIILIHIPGCRPFKNKRVGCIKLRERRTGLGAVHVQCTCVTMRVSSEDPVLSSSFYTHTHIASCSDVTEWKPADGNKDPLKHFIESD